VSPQLTALLHMSDETLERDVFSTYNAFCQPGHASDEAPSGTAAQDSA